MFDGVDPAAGADRRSGGPVLGIDPGVSRCGYGVVRRAEGGRYEAVAYGVITTPPGDPMPQRLLVVATELEALVAEHRPSALAVERVLFQTNARTAMSVGQANGLALVAAARAGVPVVEYSPNEVKLAVAGHGGADKAQVQAMVARLLQLAEVPRPPDAADALALALTHGWAGRIPGVGDPGGSSPALDAAVQRAIERDDRRRGRGSGSEVA
ncbi:MAG: crossover junction endodeoxyribonuclease RuvC [Actinomycetes bacterium]